MQMRRRVCRIIVFFGTTGALLWCALPRTEPSWQGKSLTKWLEERGKDFTVPMDERPVRLDAATSAIREIGTNGVPRLLELTEARGARLGGWLIRASGGRMRWSGNTRNHSRRLAWTGFEALGPIARPAVPGLTNLLTSSDPERRWVAAIALGYIGPAAQEAIPGLIHQLRDQDPRARSCSLWALGEIHEQPEIVVPALTAILHAPRTYEDVSREDLIVHSLVALAKFGSRAQSAVPVIHELSQEQHWSIARGASNALRRIELLTSGKDQVEPKH